MLETLARLAALAVVAVGLVVMSGWLLDVGRLRGPIPGLIEMKANTAIGFVLCGASLWLVVQRDLDPRLRRVAIACAAAAALIGALSLVEYVLGRNLGIDQLLFHDPAEGPTDPTVNPGRLAPQTCVNFMLLGLALVYFDRRGRTGHVAQGCVLTAMAIALLAVLGYAYSAGQFKTVAAFSPMAVHTSLAFLALGVGITLARPDRGVLAVLRANGAGSVMARWLLPVALVVLPVIGWLRLEGERAGLYDGEFGASLMVVAMLVVLIVVILGGARRLNRAQRAYEATERAARERQELFQAVIDNAPSIIYVKHADGRYVLVNRRFEEVTGWSKAEICGKSEHEVFPAQTADDARASDREVVRANAPVQLEITDEDGSHTYMSTKFPLRRPDGEAWGVGGIATDITVRKRAEEEATRARHEAERANRAKSAFLSRMSHELRTPLAAVLGFGQLLEMSELEARQREGVEQILKGGRHLLDLVTELLDVSRIESGSMAISNEPVDVERVIAEALTLVQPLAAARSITIDNHLGDGHSHYVMADLQRLKQVLLNLLSNAVKYNREGGNVAVSVEEDCGERLRILVADTGPGIEQSSLGKLFEPFERLGAEATGVEGTGLGMTLSRGLTEAMGGTLSVESEIGTGTTFAVELALADRREAGADTEAIPLADAGRELLGPCTILYVEDNPANFRLVERIFESHPAVTLIGARDGRTGVTLAAEHRPDLVLLDLHLPDVHGAEVLARLKRDARTRVTPVIVLTADATSSRTEMMLRSGAHAYLTKPLDVSGLLRVVAEALDGGRRAA
jgi:PAS domain S-box-containing protein